MLSYDQVEELVGALEKCEAIADLELRKTVIALLPPEWTATLGSAPTPRSQLTNIVLKCSQYPNGIETLIRVVRWQSGDIPAVEQVEQIWMRISTSAVGPLPPPPPPPPVDPDTKLASEYHWDRDEVMKVFVGLIKQDPKYAPWRLMVLRGPREAGLSTFVERLEFICREISRRDMDTRPLLYAGIRLASSMIRPDSLVTQILATLAKNSDECIAEVRNLQPPVLPHVETSYLALREEIDDTARVIEQMGGALEEQSGSAPFGHDLAKVLSECFIRSQGRCTKVLLFSDFEQIASRESGKWLLDTWLLRHIVNLEGVVIVIAGASGLDRLERRDRYTHCPKTIPGMNEVQLLEWARQGWKLTEISENEVLEANKECEGNPAQFLMYLDAWRIRDGKPRPPCVSQIRKGRPG